MLILFWTVRALMIIVAALLKLSHLFKEVSPETWLRFGAFLGVIPIGNSSEHVFIGYWK